MHVTFVLLFSFFSGILGVSRIKTYDKSHINLDSVHCGSEVMSLGAKFHRFISFSLHLGPTFMCGQCLTIMPLCSSVILLL